MSNEILEKPIFHFTHIENLQSIVEEGLKCRNAISDYVRLSHQHLTGWRAIKQVPIESGGTVGDYAPFFFAPRSPMLFSIMKGNVGGVPAGQDNIVYIQTRIRNVVEMKLKWVATDKNAVLDGATFGNTLRWLECNINWNLMSRSGFAGLSAQRMAEFLVWEAVPWSAIRGVATRTTDEQRSVDEVLRRCAVDTPTRAIPEWYF